MKYFLDTNVIIEILNQNEKAISKLQEILDNDENFIFINRLVVLEVLRTIPVKNKKIFKYSKSFVDNFEAIDIVPEIYLKTVEFSRFFRTIKHQKLKGSCEAIDLLHFVTAKYYELEIISFDKDFERLEIIYNEFDKYKMAEK